MEIPASVTLKLDNTIATLSRAAPDSPPIRDALAGVLSWSFNLGGFGLHSQLLGFGEERSGSNSLSLHRIN